MRNLVFIVLVVFFSTISYGASSSFFENCNDQYYVNDIQSLKSKKSNLKTFKHYCFADSSGKYALYLNEKQDIQYDNDVLSSSIEARLYQKIGDSAPVLFASAQDLKSENEIGVNFRSKLTELSDVDGDGLIDPIVVYKFIDRLQEATGNPIYSGRLKIVMFYKGEKIIIRAVSGELDSQRSIVANELFFKAPKSIQSHLVKKMNKMYQDRIFGFDNSNNFIPKKESVQNEIGA